MMASQHVVQELCFELDFASEDAAFDLQERVSGFARGRALQELNDAFDGVARSGTVLRLETLQLDLGWLDPADSDETWATRLRQALQVTLAELGGPAAAALAEAGVTPPNAQAAGLQWCSEAASRLQTLCHYLQHGQWPWHAACAADAAALAAAQWQQAPQALIAWLQAHPAEAGARQRLAWQAPEVWRALQAQLQETPHQPMQPAARGPQPRGEREAGRTSALRPQLRRLKALLADDSVHWGDLEQAELLALWTVLQARETEGLRQLLRQQGLQARVRRRMAAHWPQALLLRLAALWLPQAEASRLEAALRLQALAGAERREAWACLLGALLAPGGQGPVHHTAASLLQAWRGAAAEPAVPALPLVAAGAAPSAWSRLRQQSAQLSREAFLALLQQQLDSAGAAGAAPLLVSLAFDELPAAWRAAAGAQAADVAQRLHWALEFLQAAQPAPATAQALVRWWWRRLAARALCSPAQWLQCLHSGAAVDGVDQARRAAWQGWLPTPAAVLPAQGVALELQGLAHPGARAAADTADRRPAALRLQVQRAWGAASGVDADGFVQRLQQLSAPAWQALLHSALSAQDTQLLLQGLHALHSVARQVQDTRGLRQAVLALLLWGGGGVGPALGAALQALASAQGDTPLALARRAAAQAGRAGQAELHDLLLTLVVAGSAAGPAAAGWAQARHRAALLRLADALSAAPAGHWDLVAADWLLLRQAEPAALRSLLQQRLASPRDRQRVLAWLPGEAWADALALLLPVSPELARVAVLLSRSSGPHVAVDWRDAVLAWVLDQPAVQPGPAAADAALRSLLVHLAARQGLAPTRLAAEALAQAAGEDRALLARAGQALARSDWRTRGAAPAGAGADATPAPLDLAACLRGDAAAARQALRQHAAQPAARRAVAAQLQADSLTAFLALYLPEAAADLASLVRLLTLEMSGTSKPPVRPHAGPLSPQAAQQLLAEQLLCSLPQDPSPRLQPVLGELLERAATHLQLSVPLLARRLQGQALPYGWPAGLLSPWLAPTAPVVITPRAAVDLPVPAAQRLAAAVAHLRGSGVDSAPHSAALRAHWQVLVQQPQGEARQALARELESPLAAERLSTLLPPDELRQALAWLRPADAAALEQAWPALQALPAPPQRGWAAVARAVLRELFQEGRAFHGAGLLLRTAQALRRLRGAPAGVEAPGAAPAPLVLPWVPPDTGEPVFVHNAGLVLAGPYLERLFTMLQLVQGGAFVDTAAAQRACLLLQHLASGRAAAPEPELALNKLLCGLPLATPVPPAVALSAEEAAAVDGLLQAMISHWSALGRTSPEGLRQTFLLREGRLQHVNEAWQLHVPPQAFDMLLDRLPWGYGTLKFPWMAEVLHVDWR